MQVTICDWSDTSNGKPCGQQSNITASLVVDDQPLVVDLCSQHGKTLAAHARPSSPPVSTQRAREKAVGLPYTAIKQWGRANGWEVSDRGRPSQDLVNAWREASASS